MIAALVGAGVGVLTIVSARSIRGERWLYALGLLTLPGIYACFALQAGEQAVGVKEMIYGAPYVVVGVMWLAHGLYDLVHGRLITNIGVPGWYPIFVLWWMRSSVRISCGYRAEHVQGTDGVMSVMNLALLTGNIGIPGGGVNPLRGQNNVQGAAHMGFDPGILTGAIQINRAGIV